MATEQMNALLAAIASDPEVAGRFAAAASAEDAASVAADVGFEVSPGELRDMAAQLKSGELSDAELTEIAGGILPPESDIRLQTAWCWPW